MLNKLNSFTLRYKNRPFLFFLIAAFCFLVLKISNFGIGPRISDGNLYFYAANLITQGFFPYRDFFIANLPMQTLLYAGVIKIFGFNLVVFRLLLLIFTVGTSYILYSMVSEARGRRQGVITSTFFLFSSIVLITTDYATGVHEATFFLVLSWFLYSKSAPMSGFAFFIGLLFRRYILPAGFVLVLIDLLRKNFKKVFKFMIFSVVPYLLVTAGLYFLFGNDFVDDAWRYHIQKEEYFNRFSVYTDFMMNSMFSSLFVVASMFLLLKEAYLRARKKKGKLPISSKYFDLGLQATLIVIFQYIFFRYFSNVFLLYLTTVVPFLSFLASMSLTILLPKRSNRIAILLIVTISVLNIVFYQKNNSKSFVIKNFSSIVKDITDITDESETIFGSYVVTPIFALKSGREITEHEGDLNYQRFVTGSLTEEKANQIATKSAAYIQFVKLGKDREILAANPIGIKSEFIGRYCKLYQKYPLDWHIYNMLFLWKCGKR